MTALNQARADFISQTEQHVRELRDDLARFTGVLLGQGFVVVTSDSLPIKFDIDPDSRVVTNPQVTKAMMAPRFTKADAEYLAGQVRNGRGEVAKAIHIRTLLQRQISEAEAVIKSLS